MQRLNVIKYAANISLNPIHPNFNRARTLSSASTSTCFTHSGQVSLVSSSPSVRSNSSTLPSSSLLNGLSHRANFSSPGAFSATRTSKSSSYSRLFHSQSSDQAPKYRDIEVADNIIIRQIGAFEDNYIYFIHDLESKLTLCVDPGDGERVVQALEAWNWTLGYTYIYIYMPYSLMLSLYLI